MGAFGTLARFLTVCWHVVPIIWSVARERRRFLLFGGPRAPDFDRRRRRAAELRETLVSLGPTFIKLGQLLSTRPDLMPTVYIEELSELQDDVPPAPWPAARAVIEREIGPVEETFTEFDTAAISGASLGQVYDAQVDGRRVAVKVRRPGVSELVETDLRVVRWWVRLLLPVIDDARAFSLRNLADEFRRVIRQEMDYEREARNLDAIGEQFDDDPGIMIPDRIEELCTARVLTMQYVDGTKITEVAALERNGIDRRDVAVRLERAYLRMIVTGGVFHADPHPGNLAVQSDGTIVFYDFGMCGRIDEADRRRIVDFYVAVGEQDIPGILDALIALGTLREDVDRRVMGEVLELAIRDARGEELEDWRVQQVIDRIESTVYEFPLRLPSRLALVMRVATVVEGVCVTLDPEFDFISVATGFLRDEGYYEATARERLRETGDSLRQAGRAAVRSLPTIERVLDRADRDDLYVRAGIEDGTGVLAELAKRVVLGIVLAGGLLAAAVIYAARGTDPGALAALGLSAIVLLLLLRSFRGPRGIRARPKFTRRELRKRDEE